MVSRNNTAFPIEIAESERLFHRMIFEKQPQRSHLSEIIGGNRSNFKAALSFGENQAFRPHMRFNNSRSVLMLVP